MSSTWHACFAEEDRPALRGTRLRVIATNWSWASKRVFCMFPVTYYHHFWGRWRDPGPGRSWVHFFIWDDKYLLPTSRRLSCEEARKQVLIFNKLGPFLRAVSTDYRTSRNCKIQSTEGKMLNDLFFRSWGNIENWKSCDVFRWFLNGLLISGP